MSTACWRPRMALSLSAELSGRCLNFEGVVRHNFLVRARDTILVCVCAILSVCSSVWGPDRFYIAVWSPDMSPDCSAQRWQRDQSHTSAECRDAGCVRHLKVVWVIVLERYSSYTIVLGIGPNRNLRRLMCGCGGATAAFCPK